MLVNLAVVCIGQLMKLTSNYAYHKSLIVCIVMKPTSEVKIYI